MTAMFLVYMIGYAIGWWWTLWGGIVILLAGVLVCVPFILIEGNYGSLVLGIPQFVVGILYIWVWRIEKW